MFKYSKAEIELIKKHVLISANLSSVSEVDITVLANKIKKVTRKELSKTTLCRLYGLKESKFGPSLFALQVLANFCGYKSWEKFCEGY